MRRSASVRRLAILLPVIAALLAIGGYVHFKIWQHEYRHAPVREMFVANFAASAVAVVLLLVALAVPRIARAALLLSLAVAAGSLLAFALSRGPGVPTLHGNFKEHGLETTASYFFHAGSAKTILVVEWLAAVLSGWLVWPVRTPLRRPAPASA